MEKLLETKWHALETEEVFKILKSSPSGLAEKEAKERTRVYGENKLPEAETESVFLIFFRQFKSPLIYILLAAAGAVILMGDYTDGIMIGIVLLLNAVVGAIQEGRARDTLRALEKFVETKAVVIRGGVEVIIPDTELVPGDVIVLQEGEKVAADARVTSERSLKVNESALTGESESVFKNKSVIKTANLPVQEQKNMLFRGTSVVAGHGTAVVARTGLDTEIGKIAQEISSIDTEIPLKADIRVLSRIIIVAAVFISAFLFIFGVADGRAISEMFATVVSVTVSIIPEGLPIAITVILAAGVWRMSKRNALIKRLQAVEALGQADVIAVDKTGTITKNEMTAQFAFVDGKAFEVGGTGFEPKGDVMLGGEKVSALEHESLALLGKLAALCNSARIFQSGETKTWKISGDPTEAAIAVFAEKLGFNKDSLETESPLVAEMPFDYRLKYRASLHKESGKNLLSVVGAPEAVLALSDKILESGEEKTFGSELKDKISLQVHEISKKGLRVLALARSVLNTEDLDEEKVKNLVLVGLLGIRDTLRPEAREATALAQRAGIRVVMITGDHKNTAEAIAREATIFKDGDKVLTGAEIDEMSDQTLQESISGTAVFARVTPEHKMRIISAFKARGEIVAMTGDGVNDAPSLVTADLGVAMGKVGTEVAKEAADIVLLDDNFSSIVSAVEEGRNIYRTIKKVVLYLLSTSIGEILVITSAVVAGLPLPLLPTQIIWLNFVTDGFFTVAIAMEPKGKNLLAKLKRPGKYIVDTLMAKRMVVMALPMTAVTLFLFQNYFESDLTKAWTISLTVLAVFQWFNAWNCRSETKSVFTTNPFENIWMVAATFAALGFQLLAVYHPLFQKFLHTTPLSLNEWLIVVSAASTIIFTEEIRKFFARQKRDRTNPIGAPVAVN
ncbi:MAG: HAD-IC family P-type ATPase [Minisyncoccia bacterium]